FVNIEILVHSYKKLLYFSYINFNIKTREGNNRRLFINEKWKQQKEYIRTKLSEKETGKIYKKRKIDVEPVFGFLKANLSFSRFSVRGKSKVENEIGFALMAVNLRKYTATNRENGNLLCNQLRKNGCVYHLSINTTIFVYLRLVLSQPRFRRYYITYLYFVEKSVQSFRQFD